MAKDKERKIAKVYFVEMGKTGKEVAKLASVTEATVSKWVNQYGWLQERNAKASSLELRIENIKSIISSLAEQRLQLVLDIKDAKGIDDKETVFQLTKEAALIDDASSKWNKTLLTIDKENKVSLSVYLSVMEQIFSSLQSFDPTLYIGTLDFQEAHVHHVSIKLG